MLRQAQSQVGDHSLLGEHLAVIALDGVGELAVGLAMHERRLEVPTRGGLPATIQAFQASLTDGEVIEGLQGFLELHRARNTVQHVGVLPSGSFLGRWSAELERFVRSLIAVAFGVELNEVYAASTVVNDELRTKLIESESLLEAGDAAASFAHAWDAFGLARRAHAGGRGFVARTDIPELDAVRGAVDALRDRMSLAAYATDISEWDWMEAQHQESGHGTPPTLVDARRALVFVLSWVQRYEAAEARYPAERWAQWRADQRAPVTGLPGDGPRVLHVTLDKSVSGHSRRTWTAQLADVPEPEDEYASALNTAAHESDDPDVRWGLTRAGRLMISSGTDVGPEQLVREIVELFERTRAVQERWRRLQEDRDRTAADLRASFAAVFASEHPGNTAFGEVSATVRASTGGQDIDEWQIQVELRSEARDLAYLDAALTEAQMNEDHTFGPGRRISTTGSSLWIPASNSPRHARTVVLQAVAQAKVMQKAATDERAGALADLEQLEADVNRLLSSQGLNVPRRPA